MQDLGIASRTLRRKNYRHNRQRRKNEQKKCLVAPFSALVRRIFRKSLNNHWGVPCLYPACMQVVILVFLNGHESCRRNRTTLAKMVRPHAVIITTIAPFIPSIFRMVWDGVPKPKQKFFRMDENGIAILNHDID